jgi:hypothetical protein
MKFNRTPPSPLSGKAMNDKKNYPKEKCPETNSVSSMSREKQEKYWEAVWPMVQETASKSEESIDKKVFTLSAGAIGLELTLIELVWKNNTEWNWLAFVSAGLFVIALLLNLIAHLYGRKTQQSQSKMIKDFLYEDNHALSTPEIYSKMEKHAKRILVINWLSSMSVILGIIFLFVFSYLKLS